jgi:hypothetical protein
VIPRSLPSPFWNFSIARRLSLDVWTSGCLDIRVPGCSEKKPYPLSRSIAISLFNESTMPALGHTPLCKAYVTVEPAEVILCNLVCLFGLSPFLFESINSPHRSFRAPFSLVHAHTTCDEQLHAAVPFCLGTELWTTSR